MVLLRRQKDDHEPLQTDHDHRQDDLLPDDQAVPWLPNAHAQADVDAVPDRDQQAGKNSVSRPSGTSMPRRKRGSTGSRSLKCPARSMDVSFERGCSLLVGREEADYELVYLIFVSQPYNVSFLQTPFFFSSHAC